MSVPAAGSVCAGLRLLLGSESLEAQFASGHQGDQPGEQHQPRKRGLGAEDAEGL